MGWETLATIGFQLLGARSQVKQARNEAKAVVQEGQYRAENKARDTLRTTGRLTTQFLQSGLTLEGGPSNAISQAFSSGYRDIGRIAANANTQSSNIMNGARTAALEGLGESALGAGLGGAIGDAAGDIGNWAGQQAGSLFDPSPTGPYQSPFSTSSGFWG